MKTNDRYTIHVIYPTTDSNGEICGGDACQVSDTRNKEHAFGYAKKLSLNDEYYETMVYRTEGGDVVGHWYFQKGVQTHSMF